MRKKIKAEDKAERISDLGRRNVERWSGKITVLGRIGKRSRVKSGISEEMVEIAESQWLRSVTDQLERKSLGKAYIRGSSVNAGNVNDEDTSTSAVKSTKVY